MSKLYNIGHIGKSGRKLLRNQWKKWRKGRTPNSRVDFHSFLLVTYGVVSEGE